MSEKNNPRQATSAAPKLAPVAATEDGGHRATARAKQIERPRVRRRARPLPTEQDWQPPILTGGFKPRIASSVVEEFVAGHDAGDVLRELVQNEFDAGGTQVSVRFGRSRLTVIGNGRPIDAKGWSRLDVILGTGTVVGGESDGIVQPKENGIGSKNFGLRSLFLFGNRIHVRSYGRMAVLDLPAMGTQQLVDAETRGRHGATIHVPYRSEKFQSLPPFTVEREQRALDHIRDRLLATLVKLALPGTRPGIRSLALVSERTGRKMNWRQKAENLRCKLENVSAVRRIGRLSTADPTTIEQARVQVFEEVEFSRPVAIPTEHADIRYPAYYRAPGTCVRICVSVPLRRGRVDLGQRGQFYYPLLTPQCFTGFAVSVSAPFRLDADRTSLIDSTWNDWLTKQAALLVQDLLSDDWLPRFGADAFLALDGTGVAAPRAFADKIAGHLRETACWPTQDFASAKTLAKASDIVIPDRAELEGFLSSSRYLDKRLSGSKRAVDLALRNDAKRFTLNSLVRLRCAKEDEGKLSTKLATQEANYHFSSYVAALANAARQQGMARTITRLFKHLSNQNRKDLKETYSTLAADGTLRPAQELVRVDQSLWEVCPEPLASRLHSSLLEFKGIAGLCRSFSIESWIVDAANRAVIGAIEDSERETVYRHLLSDGTRFGRKPLAAIRRSPVVLDQRGNWVAPQDLAQLPPAQAALLDPVVSAPAPPLAERAELVRRLRIRQKLSAEDLIRFGPRIGGDPEIAAKFEELLTKHQHLLTPKVAASLRSIPFLHTQTNELMEPERLHLPTAVNLACLETNDAIVGGGNIALYRKLECRDRPSFETLLGILQELKERNVSPQRPDVLYPSLASALGAKKLSPMTCVHRSILWVEGSYSTPKDTLLGSRIHRFFRTVLPVFDGPDVIKRAYEQLGASPYPHDYHWIKFFEHFTQSVDADKGALRSPAERKMLREAYQRRASLGMPADLNDTVRCLLSRNGSLHSLQEMRASKFVEDDYPQLSVALIEQGADIAFADIVDGNRPFFAALRLRRLSDLCGVPRMELGTPCAAPGWFRPAHRTDILSLFQQGDFAVALRELAWTHHRQAPDFQAPRGGDLRRRLAAIGQLQFVSKISRMYRVAEIRTWVPAEAAVNDDGIALLPPRNMVELEQVLAYALAELLGATRLVDIRALAVSILPLLRCRTRGEMLAYLKRQGVIPREWSDIDPNFAETEAEEDDVDDRAEEIVREIIGTLGSNPPSGGDREPSDGPKSVTTGAQRPDQPQAKLLLPPINEVRVSVTTSANTAIVRSARGNGLGSAWTSPNSADVERDRVVGERGEELVYRLELARLRAAGHANPEKHVVWTSRSDPGADHDIVSVAADGKPLWIEVKSTMGTDGAFLWPRAEFVKALREGDHYELWRVYEAHTGSPTVKAFRDPASLLRTSALRLELNALRAFVEPKG